MQYGLSFIWITKRLPSFIAPEPRMILPLDVDEDVPYYMEQGVTQCEHVDTW